MLAEDSCKAGTLSQTAGDTVHLSADITLGYTWTNQLLGCGMHHIAHLAGTLNSLNLLWLLGGAHFYYSLNQLQRGLLLLLVGMNAQQVHNLYLGIETVWGQEVIFGIW